MWLSTRADRGSCATGFPRLIVKGTKEVPCASCFILHSAGGGFCKLALTTASLSRSWTIRSGWEHETQRQRLQHPSETLAVGLSWNLTPGCRGKPVVQRH